MQNPLNCGMSGYQNHPIRITPCTFFVTNSVGANGFSYFILVFVVLLEKMDSNEDLRTLGKAKRGRPKKKEIVTMFVEFAR